jgi:hypothetical protein
MPQIFHRSFNVISKVSILGAVFILAGLGWVAAKVSRSDYVTGVRVHREQPVPFSHDHHVGGLGIDCRYCHTSVEKSAFAGIPSTEICMNCHSQMWDKSPMLAQVRASYQSGQSIPWNRVHNLPGFAYFNHGIHVNKGVGCSSCHGRVDQMPLTYQAHTLYMEWCLDCHRHPEQHLRPADQIYNMAWQPPPNQSELGHALLAKYHVERDTLARLTSCSTCHR